VLALIAEPKICDEMVKTFKKYSPTVVRRNVADELRERLDTLHQRLAEQVLQAGAGGASASP